MDHETNPVETVADLIAAHIGLRVHVGTNAGAFTGTLSGFKHEAETFREFDAGSPKPTVMIGRIESTVTLAGMGEFEVHPKDSVSILNADGKPVEAVQSSEPAPADVWEKALAAAAHALDTARQPGGAYGQQDRRPSNFAAAATHVLNTPNPYRKATPA